MHDAASYLSSYAPLDELRDVRGKGLGRRHHVGHVVGDAVAEDADARAQPIVLGGGADGRALLDRADLEDAAAIEDAPIVSLSNRSTNVGP